MSKIIKYIGLLTLVMFSFFYTDKVAHVVKMNDSLMSEIKSVKDNYTVNSIDGVINNNTIVPGINGRSMNIDKSYKKMREKGIFDKDFVIYDKVIPKNNLNNNKDKFIISGNSIKNMVSIVFVLDDDIYLDKINNSVSSKDVIINYFVDYKYLISNSTKIKELVNSEVYNYGNDGLYTPDNVLFANNLISRIRNNDAIYCLVNFKDYDVLKLCSSNNLYTILPNIFIKNDAYSKVKKEIKSGSIVMVEVNNSNIVELGIIIDYISGKGLKIVGLSELLSEEYLYH